MPSERSKYSKDQHQLRASLEADDNDNMKNFTVFFFFFCTFVSLGALAQPQWLVLGTPIGAVVGLGLGPLRGGRTNVGQLSASLGLGPLRGWKTIFFHGVWIQSWLKLQLSKSFNSLYCAQLLVPILNKTIVGQINSFSTLLPHSAALFISIDYLCLYLWLPIHSIVCSIPWLSLL